MASTTGKMLPTRPSQEGYLARHPALGWGLMLLGGLLFGILAFSVVTNGPLTAWDKPIVQALHARAVQDTPFDIQAMLFGGYFGEEISLGLAAVLVFYWLWKRRWHLISMLLIGMAGGTTWFYILTNWIGRHRPIFADPIIPALTGPSFPSGHAMNTVLFYGLVLYLILPGLKSGWRVLAVLDGLLILAVVTYSRLYMGAHYPTDILGGFAFGLLWGGLVYTTLELLHKGRSARAAKKLVSGGVVQTPTAASAVR
jgi:membrane-associated phospholipid phosphatase